MRVRTGLLAAVLMCTALACGNETPRVSEAASVQLEAQIDEIRRAAMAGDRAAADAALGRLRSEASTLRADDALDDDALDRILVAAQRVAAELASVPTATSTTAVTERRAPPASTTTTKPGRGNDEPKPTDKKTDDD